MSLIYLVNNYLLHFFNIPVMVLRVGLCWCAKTTLWFLFSWYSQSPGGGRHSSKSNKYIIGNSDNAIKQQAGSWKSLETKSFNLDWKSKKAFWGSSDFSSWEPKNSTHRQTLDIGHFLEARTPLPSPANTFFLWDFSFCPLRLVLRGQEERELKFYCPFDWPLLCKEGAAGGMRGS